MTLSAHRIEASRVVIGGGLFGCCAAIVLAQQGHSVVLVEQDPGLLTRASYVNQARLHTGLHYPRSLLTALESLQHYQEFRDRFESSIQDFSQIYAIAAINSKTSGSDFEAFVKRLGVAVDEVDPERWFHAGSVARAFRVEEPTFDAGVLRELLRIELASQDRIRVVLDARVISGEAGADRVRLQLHDGSSIEAQGLVIAAYAGTNAVRGQLGLAPLPLSFELAEVVLGRVAPALKGHGFTVMDGPFWSLMPFGRTQEVSLTSVGLTPLVRSGHEPAFDCQGLRSGCLPDHLADCSTCHVRPPSAAAHQQQQMARFLKDAAAFTPTGSLLTVKTVMTSTEVDDARPTMVRKEDDLPVWTVLSGKVSTLLDLRKALG